MIIVSTSPVSMTALHLTAERLATAPDFAKKKTRWSSEMCKGTSCKDTFVFLVSIHSDSSLTDFVVKRLPASDLAASSVCSRVRHIALLLLANTLAKILRLVELPPGCLC